MYKIKQEVELFILVLLYGLPGLVLLAGAVGREVLGGLRVDLLDDMRLGRRAQELVLLAAGVEPHRLLFDELQLLLFLGEGGLGFLVILDDVGLEGALLLPQDVG